MSSMRRFFTLKIILVCLILINLGLGIFLIKRISGFYPSPIGSFHNYYLSRDKNFEAFPKDSNTIIFLGNSLTQNFELAELLHNTNVRNRGINGDMVAGVINRLTPVIESHPKKIFIEIGINDLGHEIPKGVIVKNYKKLIDTLQLTCPNTALYIQSILPVENDNPFSPTICSPDVNADIIAINEQLKNYTLQHNAHYVDLHNHFLTKGSADRKYFVSDGLHLSGEGYLLWSKLIKPLVEQ